jgi:hypothetical protein
MLFAVVYLLLRRLVALAGGSAEDRHSVKGAFIPIVAMTRGFL